MYPVSTAGPVVLDIGGAIGAAAVIGPSHLEGMELEIRASHGVWDGAHAVFHCRETDRGSVVAAVFPQLVEGDWEVRLRDDPDGPTATVKVSGGRASQTAFLD